MPQNNITLSDLDGVICIDCWEDPQLETFYQRLLARVNFNQFGSIVLANYELLLDGNDAAQHNTIMAYSRSDEVPEIIMPMVRESGRRKTTSHIPKTNNSFVLLTLEAFDYHVKKLVPHIKNWLVIGGSWGACTHSRPLSFKSMLHLPYNFYISDWAFYDFNSSDRCIDKQYIENDTFNWVYQQNDLYKLTNDT
jgi:hypothetical protein